MKGLSAPKIEGKLALRASITGSIYMDEVKLVLFVCDLVPSKVAGQCTARQYARRRIRSQGTFRLSQVSSLSVQLSQVLISTLAMLGLVSLSA